MIISIFSEYMEDGYRVIGCYQTVDEAINASIEFHKKNMEFYGEDLCNTDRFDIQEVEVGSVKRICCIDFYETSEPRIKYLTSEAQ
jgi:hypothetical protein